VQIKKLIGDDSSLKPLPMVANSTIGDGSSYNSLQEKGISREII